MLEDFLHPTIYCDWGHPLIRKKAQSLIMATPTETAIAIFRFMQTMPYALGPWEQKASETLQAGTGMCFTKANLQIALLRSLNIPAAYNIVEMKRESFRPYVTEDAYILLLPTFRHCYVSVYLDGRWRSCDATTDPLLARAMGWIPPMFTGRNDIYPRNERAGEPVQYANIDTILGQGPRLRGLEREEFVLACNNYMENLRKSTVHR
ncbi:transglutaminase family protein [Candidatus Woesearchaeota archaeon]|nr:transglutaminase family protein [Candidatus Woesearchaeota archaeon]